MTKAEIIQFWKDSSDKDFQTMLHLYYSGDPLQTQVNLLKLTWKFDTRIEPHPFDEKNFASSNPVIKEILRTGIEITT